MEPKACGWKCQMPELYLKEPTAELFIRAFTRLQQCKIARTNVKVGKTRMLSRVQLRAQEQAFNWFTGRVSDVYGIAEVQLVEMTGAVATKQASVTKLHVSVVWAFYKNKASLQKQRQLNLLLNCNFCLCNIFWCLSSNNLLSWEFVYFRLVFCRTLEKLVIFVQFLHYCCQLWSLWALFTADK